VAAISPQDLVDRAVAENRAAMQGELLKEVVGPPAPAANERRSRPASDWYLTCWAGSGVNSATTVDSALNAIGS